MLQPSFKANTSIMSGEEYFKILTLYGHGGHGSPYGLVSLNKYSFSRPLEALCKSVAIGPVPLEGMFKLPKYESLVKCQTMTLTSYTHNTSCTH